MLEARTRRESGETGDVYGPRTRAAPKAAGDCWSTLEVLQDLGMSDAAIVDYLERFSIRLSAEDRRAFPRN